MAERTLTREEAFGMALAALGHAALVWVLVTAPDAPPLPPPERVSVTISDEMGAVSTSPQPISDPAADRGPELGEPAPVPEPVLQPAAQPAPQPVASAVPIPRPAPAPPPPKAQPKPQRQAMADLIKLPQPPKAAPNQTRAPTGKTPTARPGATSFDQMFGKGIPGANPKGKDQTPAATQASAQQVSSWSSLIGAKVRGPWNGCAVSGLDVGKLRAAVRFTLDKSGRVAGIDDFEVTGVTDANRAQVAPFKACAVRAIKLASPFAGLPPEFYDQWKNRRLNFRKE